MTQTLEDLTEQLQEVEADLQNSLIPFLRAMFKRFYEHRAIFSNAASCVAELDCLCALAFVSGDDTHGPMCKPEIVEQKGKDVLELRQLRHPCV